MTKNKKKRDNTHDGISQTPWFLAALERLNAKDSKSPVFCQITQKRIKTSRNRFRKMVYQLAESLKEFEIQPGHLITFDARINSEVCALWCAALMIGAIPVFYPSDMRFRDKRSAYEADSEAQNCPPVIIVETSQDADLWMEASGLATPHIICIQQDSTPKDAPNIVSLSDLLRNDANYDISPIKIPMDDPAAYVYTQGAHTSAPRRIAISHAHLLAQAEDLQTAFSLSSDSELYIDQTSPHAVVLSVFSACMQSGAAFVYSELPIIDLLETTPSITHFFLLPQTILQISQKIKQSSSSFTLSSWRLSLAKFRNKNARYWLQWANTAIDKVCLTPIRQKYFLSTKAIISYGNHFESKPAELLEWFDIPTYNAFTLGELGFVHLHEFNGKGGFLKSIDARIKSGILQAKSSHGCAPYIQTGDLVFEDTRCGLCAHRSAPMTLSSGEIVDASPMRDILRRNSLIKEIIILGEARPFLTALIYIDEDALTKWQAEKHLENLSFEEATQNAQLYEYALKMIDNCNKTRATRESIQKIALLNRPLTKDPHILSPCHLTRIREVEHRYKAMIESFYLSAF